MDNSSLASEIPDLLQFLRPSVKKLTQNSLYGYKYFRELDDYLLVPAIKRRKRRRTREPPQSELESSASLILHKTLERPVYNDYDLFHLNGPQHQRHTRGDHTAESHNYGNNPCVGNLTLESKIFLHDFPPQPSQILRESTSYQQVRAKDNVYLVIAGRRTEKVYKLDTRKNPKNNTPNVNEEYRKKHATKVNQVNMPMNMDKKKKKRKVGDDRNETKLTERNSPIHQRIDLTSTQHCICRSNSPKANDVALNKSRLRITGRLGITHDDKYVLRCAATLDDKPIDANFADVTEGMSPEICYNNYQQQQVSENIAACVNETCPKLRLNQRSIQIQTETRHPRTTTAVGAIGKDSQGTQVSPNLLISNANVRQALDQIVQCGCDINDFARNYTKTKAKTDETKGTSVIVSVIPSKEPQERMVKKKQIVPVNVPTQQSRKASPNRVDNERVRETQQTKRPNTGLRSAIPRPTNNLKDIAAAEKVTGPKSVNKVRNNDSPDGTQNDMTTSRYNVKSKNDNVAKIRSRTASPERSGIRLSSSPERKKIINKTNTTTVEKTRNLVTRAKTAPVNARLKSKIPKNVSANKTQTTGTITDHAQTKKALIDSWTRQMTSQMTQKSIGNRKGLKTFNPASNVSVNIDGDNEYYDLFFRQDSMETDLTVRKRFKKRPGSANPQRTMVEDDDDQTPSMENFMPPNKAKAEKSASQTWAIERDEATLEATPSVLHVRDSIEISHRREDRALSHNIKITQTNDYHIADNSAPMKHFRGDQCSLQDPMQRDKEIRELLGVEKQRGPVQHKELNCGPSATEVIIQQYVYENYQRRRYHPELTPSSQSEEIKNEILEPKITAIEHPTNNTKKTEIQPETLNRRLQRLAKRGRRTNPEIERNRSSLGSNLAKIKSKQGRFRQRVCKKNSKYSHRAKKTRQTFTGKHHHKNTQTVLSKTSVPCKNCPGEGHPINNVKLPQGPAMNVARTDLVELFNARRITKQMKKVVDKPASPKEGFISKELSVRKAKSTLELHCNGVQCSAATSTSNLKDKKARSHLTKVIPNTEFYSKNMDAYERGYSIHTLFKGRRKSVTPNLGTSRLSLFDGPYSSRGNLRDAKPDNDKSRRPFLKRLMSCLVMRSAKASAANLRGTPSTPKALESSIDSYQINTSLAGLDLSSSIFDTSDSFYSNHSIFPTSKMKRGGFFSSVCALFMRP